VIAQSGDPAAKKLAVRVQGKGFELALDDLAFLKAPAKSVGAQSIAATAQALADRILWRLGTKIWNARVSFQGTSDTRVRIRGPKDVLELLAAELQRCIIDPTLTLAELQKANADILAGLPAR